MMLVVVVFGCRSETEKPMHAPDSYTNMVGMWEDSLSNHPVWVNAQIDSLLPLLKDSLEYYRLLIIKAKATLQLSQPDSAFNLLNKAERYIVTCTKDSHDRNLLCTYYYNLKGNIYARKVMMDSALVQYQRAYSYCSRLDDDRKRLDVMLNIADSYVRTGRYDMGSFWYRQFLSLADSIRLPEEERFPGYYGLGQVSMDLRDFAQCDYYFELAGRFYYLMKPYEKHIYLNNRGNSFYYREDYPTALKYFQSLLKYLNHYPEMEFERNLTMVNLGEVYLLMNKTDSAAYYLDRCHAFFKKIGNNSALYYIETQMIELALQQGNLQLAQKRIADAVKLDYVEPNMLHIRNKYLQHYFEKNGDYKNAYKYMLNNRKMDDSIRNERIKMRSAELALRYRQDSTLMKKEMLIQQQRNEVLQLHEWVYRGLFVVLITLSVVGGWILYRKIKRDEQERNMRTAITSLRLENVRNRISPHFIFNVLSREVMSKERKVEDESDIRGLIKLLRRNLELSDNMAVSLAEELDFVRTYVGLEQKSLQPDFLFVEEIDECIDVNTMKVPTMMIQISVENAIKHALRGKEGMKKLWIKIIKKEDGVEIIVLDNGGGYRIDSVTKGTGTGTKVVVQTIQLLNSYNDRPIVMKINNIPVSDDEIGCEVRFFIPVNYSYQLKRKKITLWKRITKQ
ncbi:histidine kinase [uncultured Bacteroides sp.]|uniref:tetratricopeptide repeat-containing sensor histidine kinase n=1 Tax=uncultured Bacteroides sp. TaxID=162156 RepID=UPI00261BA8BC|nr:histidine kinase [uncultured Bacteroides sp.]